MILILKLKKVDIFNLFLRLFDGLVLSFGRLFILVIILIGYMSLWLNWFGEERDMFVFVMVSFFFFVFLKFVLIFLLVEKIKEDWGMGKGNFIFCVYWDWFIEEFFYEFEWMKNGEYKEKEVCMRMKMDLNSGNFYMWDIVVYWVKKVFYYRIGDKWSMLLNVIWMKCCWWLFRDLFYLWFYILFLW